MLPEAIQVKEVDNIKTLGTPVTPLLYFDRHAQPLEPGLGLQNLRGISPRMHLEIVTHKPEDAHGA